VERADRRRRHPSTIATLHDEGATLVTEVRIDRRSLISGLFYGIDGMCVRGTRRAEIGRIWPTATGVIPGIIPPGALLIAEISILESCAMRA
jgi:hypothetical protein